MLVPFFSQVHGQDAQFLEDTLVCLPEGSSVKLRWVIPPSAESGFIPVSFLRKNPNFTFSVDSRENVWIGFEDRLICVDRKFAFRLSEPFRQMIQLDNGMMVFSTMFEIGFARGDEINDSGNGLPVLPFQAFARFPQPYAKILPFSIDSLLALTENDGKTTAYMLKSEVGENSNEPFAVRGWKKLFSVDSLIGAMTLVPGKAFGKFWFSIDNYVYVFDEVEHRFGLRAKLPAGEKITQLAATRDHLLYATEKQVGLIGINNHQVILQTPFPQICSRNEKLFVLFPGCMGVVEVQNIDSLAKIIN